ncbi:MAG: universal stress protein [Chloroflexota bacterium]
MFQKILFPTDGSEHSEKARPFAVDLAKLTGATIVVMHAFQSPLTLRKRGAIMLEELKTTIEEDAKEFVSEEVTAVQTAGVSATALLVEGSAAEGILRAIEEEQPDLVVMGSRGGGGLPGLRLGSVAEQIVRHSAVPVLVVK